jgi:hypothetical protein
MHTLTIIVHYLVGPALWAVLSYLALTAGSLLPGKAGAFCKTFSADIPAIYNWITGLVPLVKALFTTSVILLLTGCGLSNFQKDLNTILADAVQAQQSEGNLIQLAQLAISQLPADQQAVAQADLNNDKAKLDSVLTDAITVLKLAIATSNDSGVNVTQIEADITAAIQVIADLAVTFGADKNVANAYASQLSQASLAKLK